VLINFPTLIGRIFLVVIVVVVVVIVVGIFCFSTKQWAITKNNDYEPLLPSNGTFFFLTRSLILLHLPSFVNNGPRQATVVS
jgi:preprotein translocase subunit SecG